MDLWSNLVVFGMNQDTAGDLFIAFFATIMKVAYASHLWAALAGFDHITQSIIWFLCLAP
jgi:hypothetical protein